MSMSRVGKTVLKGHGLLREGGPFPCGNRLCCGSLAVTRTWTGHARCSCGAYSAERLPSDNARKRWHREHKDALRGGAA